MVSLARWWTFWGQNMWRWMMFYQVFSFPPHAQPNVMYFHLVHMSKPASTQEVILKFALDSVIMSLLSSAAPEISPVVFELTKSYKASSFDMYFYDQRVAHWFWEKSPGHLPVIIKDHGVDVVQHYNYLGTVIEDILTFELHADAVCKKAH